MCPIMSSFSNVLQPLNERRYVLSHILLPACTSSTRTSLLSSTTTFTLLPSIVKLKCALDHQYVCNQRVGLSTSPGMLWHVQVQISSQVNLWMHTKVRKFSCK